MNTEETGSASAEPNTLKVTLPWWVNDRPPALGDILTAYDLARLTRRPKWALTLLSLLGWLPRKQQFRGRRIGWSRSQVEQWLRAEEIARPRAAVTCGSVRRKQHCRYRSSGPRPSG